MSVAQVGDAAIGRRRFHHEGTRCDGGDLREKERGSKKERECWCRSESQVRERWSDTERVREGETER